MRRTLKLISDPQCNAVYSMKTELKLITERNIEIMHNDLAKLTKRENLKFSTLVEMIDQHMQLALFGCSVDIGICTDSTAKVIEFFGDPNYRRKVRRGDSNCFTAIDRKDVVVEVRRRRFHTLRCRCLPVCVVSIGFAQAITKTKKHPLVNVSVRHVRVCLTSLADNSHSRCCVVRGRRPRGVRAHVWNEQRTGRDRNIRVANSCHGGSLPQGGVPALAHGAEGHDPRAGLLVSVQCLFSGFNILHELAKVLAAVDNHSEAFAHTLSCPYITDL
jgi:hypothetical protein